MNPRALPIIPSNRADDLHYLEIAETAELAFDVIEPGAELDQRDKINSPMILICVSQHIALILAGCSFEWQGAQGFTG